MFASTSREREITSPMTQALGEVLDERAQPNLRARFGRFALESTEIAFAARHIRLAGVDLGADEAQGLARIRVVLAELSAATFRADAECVMADPERRPVAERLSRLLASGGLLVRVSPMAVWTPDFSVFHRNDRAIAAIFGFHWFQRPFPESGPAFATVCGADGAELAAARFRDLWSGAYDVTEAVGGMLDEALTKAPERSAA